MSLQRGKSSVSPPIQISGQQQPRTITPQSRGPTPPQFMNSGVPEETTYSVFPQAGFQQQMPIQQIGISPGFPYELNKASMAAPRMPSPGVAMQAQQNVYQQPPGMRTQTPFYPANQNIRAPRYTMNNTMMYVTPGQPGTGYPNQGTAQIIVQPSAGMMLQQPTMTRPYPLPNQSMGSLANFQPSPQYPYNCIYYQQQQQQIQRPMPGLQTQQPQQPVQQSQAPPPPKRKKHVLQIVDPTSGKNIMENIISSKHPSGSAEGEMPTEGTPPPQNEIAAKFAAQVAATLGKPSRQSQDVVSLEQFGQPPPQIPVQMMEQPPIINQPIPPLMNPVSDHMTSPSEPIVFLQECVVPIDENLHPEINVDPENEVVLEQQMLVNTVESEPVKELSPEVEVNVEIHQTESVADIKDSEPREPMEKSPDSDKENTDSVDLKQVEVDTLSELVSSDSMSEKSSVSVTVNLKDHVEERTTDLENVASVCMEETERIDPPVQSDESSSKENTPEHEHETLTPIELQPPVVPPVVVQVPATLTPVATTVTISVATTVCSTTVTTAATPVLDAAGEPASDVISQNGKKENKKKKTKDWNKKGENIEGTDMDAFLDTEKSLEHPDEKQSTEKIEEMKVEVEEMIPTEEKKKSPPPETIAQLIEEEKTPIVEIKIEDVIDRNDVDDQKTSVKTQPELKYKYKEDQWSPINLEGKKGYDRDFLLQLQFSDESITKPEGLPDLPEIILEKPHQENQRSLSSGKEFFVQPSSFDFTPGFVKGGRMSQGGNKGSQTKTGSIHKQPKIIKIDSMQKDITLHQAEKAWKPNSGKPETEKDEETKKTEELYKRTKGILNKLTPQKFSTLVDQMMKLQIDTETRLKGVIDLVFEKAIGEPGFSVAYANMCRCLCKHKVSSDSKPGEQVNFRALLLTRCQREFEKDKDLELDMSRRQKEIDEAKTDEKKAELKQAMVIAETTARRRSLGNIRFIGELFKLKMLTENIMHDCVFKLLRAKDLESLECLCRLVTTIGKELDTVKAKNRIDQYFQQMIKIISEKKTSSRVRFMLQDVLELRQNKWVPRRDESAPKTIDQIHKEAQQEAIEKQLMIQQLPHQQQQQQQQQKGQRRGRGHDTPRGGQMGSIDGWNTVPPKTPLRSAERSIDPIKLRITKQNDADTIQLGPGGGAGKFSKWHRGSTGGGVEPERASTPSNRFSALSKSEDDPDRRRGFSSSSPARRGDSRGDSRGRVQNQGGFPRPARVTPRSSQEYERERAVAAVKTVIGTSGRTTPSDTRSRESSGTREREPERTAPPGLSSDDMEKKTKSIIDEYLHLQDNKEATLCVSELNSPKTIHMFVYAAINHVLERSDLSRQHTGNLLYNLVKQKIIDVDDYLNGLNEIMQYAEDMEIDIPKIWVYLGQLIGPMIQDSCVPLNFLTQIAEPLQASNKAGLLLCEILQDASHKLGHKKVGELWKSSGLDWNDFVKKEELSQFLVDKKLEFTIDAPSSHPTMPTISMENIQEELNLLLLEKHADDDVVFDWIEANIDESTTKQARFIRALMTAVCSSAISGQGSSAKVDPNEIKKRSVLLQKYLDHQAEFELQALYALQAVVHKLEHPQGVLRTLFDTLYDEDIISEVAFNHWEKSNDQAEQEGKGVAMKQVVSFFTWLYEAEEESQDES